MGTARTRQDPPPAGLAHVSVQLSPVLSPFGQAAVMPSEAPTVRHWRSRDVHTPDAHSSPVELPLPEQLVPGRAGSETRERSSSAPGTLANERGGDARDAPSSTVASSGHEAFEPLQKSATSHSPTDGRQTVLAGLNVQLSSQHVDDDGSHWAPLRNRQAAGARARRRRSAPWRGAG